MMQKQKTRKGGFLKTIFIGMILLGIVSFFGIFTFLSLVELKLPNIEALKDVHLKVPLRIFTKDGKLITEFGEMRRIPVSLKEIPKTVIDATLATEDQRFYEHSGVDILGLARAAVVLVLTGQKRQGGSTITMQVARNFFLTRKKSYYRKIREILLALEIDHEFSKDKILELYFNKIFYGNRAYGIAAAAQIYYGKKLNELTLPQIAMLVGLPKAPSSKNPIRHPQAALQRRNHVLARMRDLGYINQATYVSATQAPITASYHDLMPSVKAPYVAEMARQALIDQLGKDAYEAGYDVYTTIDSRLQKLANKALEKGLLTYDQRHGYRGPIGHIDQLDINDSTSYDAVLQQIPDVNSLKPAVVIDVEDTGVTALLKSQQVITIPWDNMKWARKQFFKGGQEYLGIRPKKPADVLNMGDIIYTKQKSNHSWALSQIPQAEAAIVALNPNDGSILALRGGFNFYRSNFNRVTQAYRQPGSSFKPFLYSAALSKGFTLATVINDAPVVLSDTGANMLWRPENDTERFYGPTRLRVGLRKSQNLVSIRLLQLVTVPYLIQYATSFGFPEKQLPNSLSLALGTATVTPLQMASAYSIFANGGYKVTPYVLDHIIDSQGKEAFQAQPQFVPPKDIAELDTHQSDDMKSETNSPQEMTDEPAVNLNYAQRVITPQNAYLMRSAMKDVIRHGTARLALKLHRSDLAGKTGTTNLKKDGWFCGFNSRLVAVTWIGFDQPRPLYEYAASSVLPMWIDFMGPALHGTPKASMEEPDGIVSVRIDNKTGLLASPGDTDTSFELFRKKYVPSRMAPVINNSVDHSSEEADNTQLY